MRGKMWDWDDAVLRFLADHPGSSVVPIAEHLGLSRGYTSRLLTSMKHAGLVSLARVGGPTSPYQWSVGSEETDGFDGCD